MDYQENNQPGNPQNTGEPYNNTDNTANPYNNSPVNNGNPDGNVPDGGTSYGNAPYGNTPNNGNSPGSMPGNGNPYGNMPDSTNPYGSPYNNNNPYNRNPYNNPYNNGNPYYNGNPYHNGNPYGNVNARMASPLKSKGDNMATAAMVLGIISLISLLLLRLYIPFLLGGVGIILAVLSRGKAIKMTGKARAGLICCITGLVLDIVLCIFSVYLVFALPDIMPEMMDEVNEMCEDKYGMSYDEILDELYEMWDIER